MSARHRWVAATAVAALAGCGVFREPIPPPPELVVPLPEDPVDNEVRSLPLTDLVWRHRLDVPAVSRVSAGFDALYVETPGGTIFSVLKESGTVRWVYSTIDGWPFDYPPVEAQAVPEHLGEVERERDTISRQIDERSRRRPIPYDEIEQLRRRRSEVGERLRAAEQGDNIYLIAKGKMYALDRRTGRERWTKRLGFVPAAKPAATRTQLFVSGADMARVHVLSVEEQGRETAFYRPPMVGTNNHVGTAPVVYDPHVFFGTYDGALYGYNARSGELEVTFSTNGMVTNAPIFPTLTRTFRDASGQPRVQEWAVAIFPSLDQGLYALDMGTRSPLWRFELGGTVRDPVLIDGDLIFAKVEQDALVALEAIPAETGPQGEFVRIVRQGILRWRLPLGESFLMRAPRGGILALGQDNTLYELDAANGRLRNRYPLALLKFFVPAPNGNTLYLATERGHLLALRYAD